MNQRLMILALCLMSSAIICAMDQAIIVYRGTPSEQVRQKVEEDQRKKEMHRLLITKEANIAVTNPTKEKERIIDVIMGAALSRNAGAEEIVAFATALQQQGMSLQEIQARIRQLRGYKEHVRTYEEQTYHFDSRFTKK